jgi:hypothetical protein
MMQYRKRVKGKEKREKGKVTSIKWQVTRKWYKGGNTKVKKG